MYVAVDLIIICMLARIIFVACNDSGQTGAGGLFGRIIN